jgi:hypothetical protein
LNILVQKIPNFQIPNYNVNTRGFGEFWNLEFHVLENFPFGDAKVRRMAIKKKPHP